MKKAFLLTIMMLCVMACNTQAQDIEQLKNHEVFVYGVVFSTSDSTVYMTDVQQIENAQITKKNGFLYGRSDLSSQLKGHMYLQGIKNHTCSVSYNVNRTKAEKKYLKQKRFFQKKGFLVKFINTEDFLFKAVRATEKDDLEFVDGD